MVTSSGAANTVSNVQNVTSIANMTGEPMPITHENVTIHNIKAEALPQPSGDSSAAKSAQNRAEQQSASIEQLSQPASNIILTAGLCDPSLQPIAMQPIQVQPIDVGACGGRSLGSQPIWFKAEPLPESGGLPQPSPHTVQPIQLSAIQLPAIQLQPVTTPANDLQPIRLQPIEAQFLKPAPLQANGTGDSRVRPAEERQQSPVKKRRLEQTESATSNGSTDSNSQPKNASNPANHMTSGAGQMDADQLESAAAAEAISGDPTPTSS